MSSLQVIAAEDTDARKVCPDCGSHPLLSGRRKPILTDLDGNPYCATHAVQYSQEYAYTLENFTYLQNYIADRVKKGLMTISTGKDCYDHAAAGYRYPFTPEY